MILSATGPDADALAPISMRLQESDPDAFSAALFTSFSALGFAVISDPAIEPACVEEALTAARAFFALPEAEKRAFVLPGRGGARGFTPFGRETAKGASHHDLKEFWHVGRDLPPGSPYAEVMPPNVWPPVPGFKEAVGGLYAGLDALGQRLLSAIARGLGRPGDFFEAPTRFGNSVLRLLHYPPTDGEGPHVRAGAHEDINVITLLFGAEEAGLEIRTRTGRWLPVRPPPGALVCNIGDMLQLLTNGRLPSTTHRVVNPAPDRRGLSRYSTPFFLHFAPDYVIEALPECVAPGETAPAPITAQAFLEERLREIGLL